MRSLFVSLVTVFMLSVSSTAMAQVSTVVLASQQRQGTFISASQLLPNDDTVKSVRISLQIPTADFEDVNNSIKLNIEVSFDGGNNFVGQGGITWKGGRFVDKFGNVDPDPYVEFGLRDYAGLPVRATVDIPTRMRVGVTVTLNP